LLYDLKDTTDDCLYGDQVRFLKSVTNNTFSYAGVISEAYGKSVAFDGYPDNELASQLAIISRLIKGGLGTKVYYVTLSGFDTHKTQAGTHEDLITRLADSVSAFYDDLKNAGWDDKVLTMTVSEFGRRVAQNGSGGTAHGNGSCSMLYGPALKGSSFVGEHPSLSDRNLTPGIDWRQMYASVLRDWFCVDEQLIKATTLLGGEFSYLDLGFECETETFIEEEEEEIVDTVDEQVEEEVIVAVIPPNNEEAVDEPEEEVVDEPMNEEEVVENEPEPEEEETIDNDVENEIEEEEEEVISDEVVDDSESIVEENEEEAIIRDPEEAIERFTFNVVYSGEQTLLRLENDTTAHIEISLFDMTGKKVSSVRNGILFEGTEMINVRDEANQFLNPGMYICRVYKSGKRYTKKVLLN